MFDLIAWVKDLGNEFGPFANLVSIGVPAFALGSVAVGAICGSRLRRSAYVIAAHTDDLAHRDKRLAELGEEKSRLEKQLKDASARLPEDAIERAEHYWRDDNRQRGILELERWFEATGESIATIAMHLAKFHISRSVPDPGDHLDRARNMLRLARGASPSNREAEETERELDRVNAALQEQLILDGDLQIAWHSTMRPHSSAQGEELRPITNVLREIAEYYFAKGMWRLAPIFADRASEIAWTGGRPLRQLWLSVEAGAAFFKIGAGHYAEALERVERALMVTEDTAAPGRIQPVLYARLVRSYALDVVGRYGEALTEIETNAPVLAEVQGERHPQTLGTRSLRARVLRDLGRYSDALAEIEAYAPVETEVRGELHPEALLTRALRASVLRDLGRYSDALAEIEAYAPVETEVRGERHPDNLVTRSLRASVLRDLGRYSDALAEIEAYAPVETEVRGERHPQTLVTRSLRASVLRATSAAIPTRSPRSRPTPRS